MSLSERQLAAFKAINQQVQRLARTPQTREVREVMEQITAITRVQTNLIIDENKSMAPAPDTSGDSTLVRVQKAMAQTPSRKTSNIMWLVVLGLWTAVTIIGIQQIPLMFK